MTLLLIFIPMFILVIFILINFYNKSILKKLFNKSSVIVFGSKGTGKDLIFNYITNTRKKYYANIPYKQKGLNLIELHSLSCKMTYNDFINNNIVKSFPIFNDGVDTFISDAGVYFPSQYDSMLHKVYPHFSVFYALSRHLYLMNIHCNTQSLDRVWKALREQADIYIKCLQTIKLPFVLVTKYRIYDKFTSAQQDIRPLKRSLIKSETGNVHLSNVGLIKDGFIIQFKKSIKYNTRYFKTLLLESEEKIA